MDSKSKRSIPYGSQEYFAVCCIGGTFSASAAHLGITPIDVIKCRMQTQPAKYTSIFRGGSHIFKEAGLRGLTLGWAPTAIGYAFQGVSKFGVYEMFKLWSPRILGEEKAQKYRMLVWSAGAGLGEAIGDALLAPFEAAKVRIQTDATAPRDLRKCMQHIYKESGLHGLYKGLPPLWMRQIPCTVSAFVSFDYAIEAVYKYIMPKPRAETSRPKQIAATVVTAYLSGVFCAIISHPPDVLVSLMYRNSHMTFGKALKKMWRGTGIWVGLSAHMLMISSIAAAQLIMMDSIKLGFGLETKK